MIKRYMSQLREKFIFSFRKKRPLQVFETKVGVKYKGGRFDSDRFKNFVIEKIPLASSSFTFNSLLLPPELLRNQYTLCGTQILHSPHFHFMKANETRTFDGMTDYLHRCEFGTIDLRLPKKRDPEVLIQKYQSRVDALQKKRTFTISVVKIPWRGESALVIADGKHRAALAASLNRPESICLQMLSTDFLYDKFYQKVYSFVLELDAKNYSINQRMIRTLLGEYKT